VLDAWRLYLCSLFMGSVEVPSQGAQIIKVPAAHYEFGANLIDQRVYLLFFYSPSCCIYLSYLGSLFISFSFHSQVQFIDQVDFAHRILWYEGFKVWRLKKSNMEQMLQKRLVG